MVGCSEGKDVKKKLVKKHLQASEVSCMALPLDWCLDLFHLILGVDDGGSWGGARGIGVATASPSPTEGCVQCEEVWGMYGSVGY
jgi:hypothetical protein